MLYRLCNNKIHAKYSGTPVTAFGGKLREAKERLIY